MVGKKKEAATLLTASTYTDSMGSDGAPSNEAMGEFFDVFKKSGLDPAAMDGYSFFSLLGDDVSNYCLAKLPGKGYCLLSRPMRGIWIIVSAGPLKALKEYASRYEISFIPAKYAIRSNLRVSPLAGLAKVAFRPGFPASPASSDGAGNTPGKDALKVPSRTILDNKFTRSEFYEPVDRKDFDEVSSMQLSKWRRYLTPDQRTAACSPRNGCFMVTGGAGTGKTVVALHRAAHLVKEKDWSKDDRLLFTTFTATLAADINKQLDLLFENGDGDRSNKDGWRRKTIEVRHLHGWVRDFLHSEGIGTEIIFPGDKLWNEALAPVDEKCPSKLGTKSVNVRFYRSEFDHVVLANNVRTLEEYLNVSRRRRSLTLGRHQREAVWPIMAEMRERIEATGKLASRDAFYLAISLIKAKGGKKPYRAVIVDEAQDFENEAFRLLRAMTESLGKPGKGRHGQQRQGDIFIVGDDSQRIFGAGHQLMECGICIRAKKTKRLVKNHRTTAETRSAALLVLEDNLEKIEQSEKSGKLYADDECLSERRGPLPEVYDGWRDGKGLEGEARWIQERIRELQNKNRSYTLSDFALGTHSKKSRDEYVEALRRCGIDAMALGQDDQAAVAEKNEPASAFGRSNPDEREAVRVSTLHRLKGLEFKAVFIVGADVGSMPSRKALEASGFGASRKEELKRQRTVFYVALTRARDRAYISCRRSPGLFMRAVSQYCQAMKRTGRDVLHKKK